MTPEQLSDAVVAALRGLVDGGELTLSDGVPSQVTVERPRQQGHGDYATNVALQLAKRAGTNPRELAGKLAAALQDTEGIAAVEIAGPGFLNITVEAGSQGQIAADIVAAGAAYGRSDLLRGESINVEFISANPTGPLHLGHTRWAAVGDALARVLEAAGAKVAREFYINDRGSQMDLFGDSILARALGEEPPEGGYLGVYVHELAEQVLAENPGILELPEAERQNGVPRGGLPHPAREPAGGAGGVPHDVRRLVQRADPARRRVGHRQPREAARRGSPVRRRWRALDAHRPTSGTTRTGCSYGRTASSRTSPATRRTTSTSARRGFDRCIYLLGADHHGYVGRLRAMAACAGDDPDANIEVLIGQMVKIMQGGEELRLSKRAGTMLTLRELIDLIGVDALRYTLARYPADSPLTLDAAEMTRQASDNPVFYVQYAHARVSSILRNGADTGLSGGEARRDC